MAASVQSDIRLSFARHAAASNLQMLQMESRLDNVAEEFVRALRRRNLADKTIQIYSRGLIDLFRFLRQEGLDDLRVVNRELLERWQDSMLDRARPLKVASRSAYGAGVKQLMAWAADRGLVADGLERAIVTTKQRGRPRPLSPQTLATMRSFLEPRRRGMTELELRDRAMFHYFLTSGGRVSEVLQVTRASFENAAVRQKGGTEKQLTIPPTVVTFVREYLALRTDNLPWLWIAYPNGSQKPRRLTDAGVREVWHRLSARLRVERFTTHQLRHTCATEMLDAGVGEAATADHLGHHDLSTLQVYGQVRGHQRKEALDVMERLIEGGPRTTSEGVVSLHGLSRGRVGTSTAPLRPKEIFEAVRLGLMTASEARGRLGLGGQADSPQACNGVVSAGGSSEAVQLKTGTIRMPDWFAFVLSLWPADQRPARLSRNSLIWMGTILLRAGHRQPCELANVLGLWDEAFAKSANRLKAKTHHGIVGIVTAFGRWAASPSSMSEDTTTWSWAIGQWSTKATEDAPRSGTHEQC